MTPPFLRRSLKVLRLAPQVGLQEYRIGSDEHTAELRGELLCRIHQRLGKIVRRAGTKDRANQTRLDADKHPVSFVPMIGL
jgi:hypothetical protein